LISLISTVVFISLSFSWVGLVGKNYEIECVIAELEKEVVNLRKQQSSNE